MGDEPAAAGGGAGWRGTHMESALYVVSTPIGNMGDVTSRAVDTLREADVVYAEDTRRTGRLLSALGVQAPLRSLHAHNEAARTEEVLERLRDGARCALVSDAGTPVVSDPGRRVVAAVLEAGLRVVPIPGASAVIAALSCSGLSADRFLFAGFPPRSGTERTRWLRRAARSTVTVVAFESPHRAPNLLRDLLEAGLGERRCTVARELTKLHEEVLPGTVRSVAAELAGRPRVRGEVTVVLEGASGDAAREEPEEEAGDPRDTAEELAAAGLGTRDIAERLQAEHGLARNEAYRLGLEAAEGTGE